MVKCDGKINTYSNFLVCRIYVTILRTNDYLIVRKY